MLAPNKKTNAAKIECSECDGSGLQEPGTSCCGGQQCASCSDVVGGQYVRRACSECLGTGEVMVDAHAAHVLAVEAGDACPIANCNECGEAAFERSLERNADGGGDSESYRNDMVAAGRGHLLR